VDLLKCVNNIGVRILPSNQNREARYIEGVLRPQRGSTMDPRDLFKNLLISQRVNRRDIWRWRANCSSDCCAFGATQELYFCIVGERLPLHPLPKFVPLQLLCYTPIFFIFPPAKSDAKKTFGEWQNKNSNRNESISFASRENFNSTSTQCGTPISNPLSTNTHANHPLEGGNPISHALVIKCVNNTWKALS